MAWTAADIPDQTGRTVVVTGANSGIGLVTATVLARAGSRVICACRNTEKGRAAISGATGSLEVRRLDLAVLASVRAFAEGVDEPITYLINNAGVMAVPRSRTVDGFECHLGTNYLGHFALTGYLLPKITGRVVTLSSLAHKFGRIRLDDLNWERRRYRRWPAYAQSKLACLMFAYELQRRLRRAGSPVRSMAAHPGWAATGLMGQSQSLQDPFMRLGARFLAQPAERGAWPTLCAATLPDLAGGSYIGPDGLAERAGHPRPVRSTKTSYDNTVQRALWEASEQLTDVHFSFSAVL